MDITRLDLEIRATPPPDFDDLAICELQKSLGWGEGASTSARVRARAKGGARRVIYTAIVLHRTTLLVRCS